MYEKFGIWKWALLAFSREIPTTIFQEAIFLVIQVMQWSYARAVLSHGISCFVLSILVISLTGNLRDFPTGWLI